jgi:hypothetical protein
VVSGAVDGFLTPILNDLAAFRAMAVPGSFISKCKFLVCASNTGAQFQIPSIGMSKTHAKVWFGLMLCNPVQCGLERRQSIRMNRLPFCPEAGLSGYCT